MLNLAWMHVSNAVDSNNKVPPVDLDRFHYT